MKEIIYQFKEIDYVLVHWPENKYTPWVAAWGYNFETGNWCQGHYFQTKESAMCYIGEKYQEKFQPPVRKTPREEIEEAERLCSKYAYTYDIFECDKGIVFAESYKEAKRIIEDEYDSEACILKAPDVLGHLITTDSFY